MSWSRSEDGVLRRPPVQALSRSFRIISVAHAQPRCAARPECMYRLGHACHQHRHWYIYCCYTPFQLFQQLYTQTIRQLYDSQCFPFGWCSPNRCVSTLNGVTARRVYCVSSPWQTRIPAYLKHSGCQTVTDILESAELKISNPTAPLLFHRYTLGYVLKARWLIPISHQRSV